MFADVTSANIVGYDTTDLQLAGLSAGAAFVPVSGNVVDLIDITVTGYKDAQGNGTCEGGVQAQTLDAGGGTDKTYEWYDVDYGGGDVYYGWYPLNEEENIKRGDVTVQPGEGLWFYCTASSYSFQSSGQVPTDGDVETNLQIAGLTIANPTPVKVDLVDCEVGGYKDEQGEGTCEGGVQVQTLDAGGGTLKTYEWYDVDYGGGDLYYGWYPLNEEENVKRDEVTLDPGAGLWSYCTASGYTFIWPKVDVK